MAVGAGITEPLLPVSGISLGVTCAGIKKVGRRDLTVIELTPGSTVGAVFTKNAFCAAPVTVCKQHLAETNDIRLLVINTGNANAGTGKQGLEDAMETCTRLAAKRSVDVNQVLPFSTGVIGEYLPMTAISNGLPNALEALAVDNWMDAAQGIMTTDTRPKGATRQFEFEGETITVTGISKGSGMIRPNMATMLAFVATDAKVPAGLLQKITTEATESSFNRITVDSDTSTNDACVLMATGQSNASAVVDEADPLYQQLLSTVKDVMLSLAHQIIRDGEGANKFIEVKVEGAVDRAEALKVAYSVADSPLFKTAMSASDANWGRILMAVGKSGVENLDVDQIDVYLGDVQIVDEGQRAPGYTEEQGTKAVSGEEINVRICLARGEVTESVWTSDLSYEYVRINAEYRS
ncbi:bifunctional glutamate N-acetyltransferase/amino-acid acetyltransferase ArgJ [Reinekea marinisedimentorum]|uniref:Arginine biosynthesis bifunctional protein ArgJ n=1 Tax=Reinekea marinisedimentorum TaxID=230495 RepID=A0A4V2UJW0_9GAMM|nr:bifunctional glutamate N-acetyltransferase/amino-acid acetyltransferase ArgJ [Reinekea marinisedimentorum]TCS41708.1 glutamate N-acetyltransferase/amino-acid N-acetyltransferase [Reinekea marinisedimentorum]